MTAATARALTSAGHRIAQALLTLGAAVAAHHASRDRLSDAAFQPHLDQLATGVVQATDQIAARLRTAGSHAAASRLPPLRALQRAIWPRPADEVAGQAEPPDAESAGLFAATDGLVDAINTAAHVLGADAVGQRG